MTSKEKAKELVELYCQLLAIRSYEVKEKPKQCALIAVEEIIKVLVDISNGEFTFIYNVEYWQEVKQEIINL